MQGIEKIKMIKLVVTDLDGTLLDSNKNIHPGFWALHKKMTDKGILFSVASGRQLFNLEETFSPIAHNTLFIAENGTYVSFRGRDLHVNPMDFNATIEFIKIARKINGIGLVLCCKNAAYIESHDQRFVAEVNKYYSKVVFLDDLTQANDTVLKLALFDFADAEINIFPHFRQFENQYKVVVSGKQWMDISHISANKGSALEKIQKELGFNRDEIMAFGDFLNDYEMMELAGHSFAMKNAHPEIIKISRFVTEYDNDNNGVVETIEKVCFS